MTTNQADKPSNRQTSFWKGIKIGIGLLVTSLTAVAVTGTIKTWTVGETLKAADLNTTITSLKTTLEGIPTIWAKNEKSAVYTEGFVAIGTSCRWRFIDWICWTRK